MISVAAAYNLPATVVSVTLTLNALTFCRARRGNITGGSAAAAEARGGWPRSAIRHARQATPATKSRTDTEVVSVALVLQDTLRCWNDGAIAATNFDLRLPAGRIIFAQMDFAHSASLARASAPVPRSIPSGRPPLASPAAQY